MTDASSMAQAISPPEVILPRLRWVPLVGRVLSQLLPPRRHVGRVLSWQEFFPFQQAFILAQQMICEGCGQQLHQEDGEWVGCGCAVENPRPRSRMDPGDFVKLTQRFLRAQGIPWRPILTLPGSVLFEVISSFFALQTRANLAPIDPLMAGTNSQPRAEGRQRVKLSGRHLTPS